MDFSLHSLSPSLAGRWDRASSRERWLVGIAAAVVILAAAWTWVWQPMQLDTTRMQRDLPRAKGVLAGMRAQVDDLATLQRTSAAAKTGDPRTAVERVLAERGLRPAVASLDVQDGRVRLTFAAVRFDALIPALDALRKTDGLRAVDIVLATRVEPGTVRAELTLAR